MSKVMTVRPGSKAAERKDAIKVVKSALGKETLATLTAKDLKQTPKETEAPPPPKEPRYTCITQRGNAGSVASIMVGLGDTIPRWKLGSIINFATYADGYPKGLDPVYAAQKLIEAAEEWNGHNVGVTFKWVPDLEDAAFVLAYGGPLDGTLASAFFPDDAILNTLWVYLDAFDKVPRGTSRVSNYDIMKNVFLHELGHVLGLRHEFSMDPGPRYEGGAMRLGSANPVSVMSYVFPPTIQDTDIKDIKDFYHLPGIEVFHPDN